MKLLRAATLSVANLDRSIDLYGQWLDYTVAERGPLDAALATSWGTPGAAGRPSAVLRPSAMTRASGAGATWIPASVGGSWSLRLHG